MENYDLEYGMVVLVLLIAQIGDVSYRKLTEDLGNSSSSVLTASTSFTSSTYWARQLDQNALPCPWQNFSVVLVTANLNPLLLFWI